MEGKAFSLKSGNKTSFKNMGSSPLHHEKGGEEHKHLFEKITGKKFSETKFGKALNRGKEQILKNVHDDVKGNLWEGVGKSVLTPEPHDNESPKDDDGNAVNDGDGTETTALNEEQMNAGNLNDFYNAGGGNLPTISERRKIYEEMGGEGYYTGSREQNSQLLKHLKQ